MSESTQGRRLARNLSTSLVNDIDNPVPPRALPAKLALAAVSVPAALWLFVLALQLIKTAAAGLSPLLEGLSADGVAGLFGFGWLASYAVMSGSPVAAAAMSLFAGGVTGDAETFAMINGSRLGASLIVLVVGFVAYVTGRRSPDGLYIGVVAMLTAITLWAPVLPIGLLVLEQGWLDGVNAGSPALLSSFVGAVSDPAVERLDEALPAAGLFVAGVAALAAGFALFDRVLPNLERPGPRFESLARALQRPQAMFAFGALVTLLTLSVSLSVTILVPLALKGYIQRDRIVPYVMGANIATWIDTLVATVLLDSPGAFTIVLTQMLVGGVVSLAVLLLVYGPYTRLILGAAHWVSGGRRRLAGFAGVLLLMPVGLLVVS